MFKLEIKETLNACNQDVKLDQLSQYQYVIFIEEHEKNNLILAMHGVELHHSSKPHKESCL